MIGRNDLEPRGEFVARHIGPSAADQARMLAALGVTTLDDLIDETVPEAIRSRDPLALPRAKSEVEALAAIRALADKNEVFTSLIGMGYSDTITPGVIRRNVLENPAWYTAYTPYQPEISQGRLEALLNFQTMICDLTGMEIANASMLDESTAAAEAMTMLHRSNPKAGNRFLVDEDTHPQTIDVVQTRAEPLGIEIVIGPVHDTPIRGGFFGVLVQYPGSSGAVRPLEPVIRAAHENGSKVAVAADLLALVMLASPGSLGADVVVGSAQRFGVPLGYGGPHAGFLAARDADKRTLPGRLVGVSIDAAGRPALRLALQTREQHIRREKATSNICTAQVLLAVIAGLYAAYHGPDGLRAIAQRVHLLTTRLAAKLSAKGVKIVNEGFFDTITVNVPGRAHALAAAAREQRINLRVVSPDLLGISLDETSTEATVNALWSIFGISGEIKNSASTTSPVLSRAVLRQDAILTHPVFHRYHSETEMLRYLRRLADRDLALDRSMIPLGSCTMKLNATSEMEPITWPEFANIHPFAPLDQAAGYRELFADLEAWLVAVTGYDAVSLQPNAGSQGELAGLLAIRAFHRANGDAARDVCLIPSSAHGTNAASAAMAGMRVVVVACDPFGNVDVDDLVAKADAHAADLAALMITYPSTHGVFETRIGEICEIVHRHGGQVYLDGANLNALVGLAAPGAFGADVSHLNLHKTFCIPHGGGGPGVGPIGVRAHLAPYLPNHPVIDAAGPKTGIGAISGAPWGSAGILPIPWLYITMMGGAGLTDATKVAILNANYVASELAADYPILYTGEFGRVAHECIIDVRPITAATGVTVDDIAKRLVDFGFHAPTISFPVSGTLMIEPTESEGIEELDRFVTAMRVIRDEIRAVEKGEFAVEDSALRNAPHPAADLLAAEWTRPYSREEAAYPVPGLADVKYWPPVSRIDGAYGDRNVFCTCPVVVEEDAVAIDG
jgi:glycine dehydrogenase